MNDSDQRDISVYPEQEKLIFVIFIDNNDKKMFTFREKWFI